MNQITNITEMRLLIFQPANHLEQFIIFVSLKYKKPASPLKYNGLQAIIPFSGSTQTLEKHQHLVRLIFFYSYMLLWFYVYSIDFLLFMTFCNQSATINIVCDKKIYINLSFVASDKFYFYLPPLLLSYYVWPSTQE